MDFSLRLRVRERIVRWVKKLGDLVMDARVVGLEEEWA